MAYTGGELNNLNGKYGISAPYKSVPVMKLIKEHRPKTKEELYELIRYHHENSCACGVKSQGSVEDFGKNLYDAQIREWGQVKYSLQECIQWEYDLFVVQSLKGTVIENKAVIALQTELTAYKVIVAEGFVDEELRIDLIVVDKGIEKCGIQVKPHSYNHVRPGVKTFNKVANAEWEKPVHYLFYDENERFTNLNEVISLINNE